jgi:hypothetical protein
MLRNIRTRSAGLSAAGLLLFGLTHAAPAQERRASRIDVDQVTVDAEVSPSAQTISAKAVIQFTPLDDSVTSATFELNNALSVARVTDGKGAQIPASRNQQDSTVRLSFDPLPKGQPVTVTFEYDGKLSGAEESPVYGIKFAAIQPDYAYLMYPARWFPVYGYTTDRFAADLRITVPAGFTVLGSGIDSQKAAGEKTTYEFKFERRAFPGSIAVVKGAPVKVQEEGVTTSFYFRGEQAEMAQAYGEQIGREMSWFTGSFGMPLVANLTVIQTEEGAPNGYAAPGLIFLSPRGIGRQPNARLLANQISRQWWEQMVSPATRNHLWLTNGLAEYSELLWVEHSAGAGALASALKDVMVEALTADEIPEHPPVMDAARLEDYSPEMWALTGAKGAAVLGMLRFAIGDEKFMRALQTYAKEYAFKSATTDDFRKVVESVTGENMDYFFIQWIQSSSAPEFKLQYTIFRTSKGFRVMGKVSQDLDTYRMPVELKIETDGDPEIKRVEVAGTASEFSVDTFGKPKNVIIDPNGRLLRYSPDIRVAVAIRRGEQYAEVSEFNQALKEYDRALTTNRNSSLAHYRQGEVYFLQQNWQRAADQFREVLNGDLEPKWTVVWAHINLGKIFDVSGQRDRAVNEYQQAQRTKDDTQNAQEEAAKHLKTPYERQQRAER